MRFKEIPVDKIMDFFKTYFPEKEGYSVNSVGYDEEEDLFVVKCFGRDKQTNDVYMFTLFALNPKCSAVADEEFYPIAWQCDEDFWTGDEVQEEYPKFINSMIGKTNKIVIKVSGGMVQDVYSTDECLEVIIVDQDSDVDDPECLDIDDVELPEYKIY